MTTPIDRLPPHHLEAEEAVLGSCLIDPEAITRVSATLAAADFYIVKHQWVYAAQVALYQRQQPIDFVTLTQELDARGQLAEIGGPAFVSQLINSVPTAIHAEGYADIVRRKALRRKMLLAASRLAQLAYDESGDEAEQLSQARGAIATIEVPIDNVERIDSIVTRVDAQVEDRYEHPLKAGQVNGMATGLTDFDAMTGGLERKVLEIFAARPGMGKTSLLLQIAIELARREGRRIFIGSLEMSKEELIYRQLSRLMDVPVRDLKAGRMPDECWPEFLQAQSLLSTLPVYIYDMPSPSLAHIESAILKHGPFDVVILDHLGLMHEVQSADDRAKVNAIGRVTRACKVMAKTYDVCFCLISQLSRACESRDDKRPVLSDLRDSGHIDQDADDVYMLYRDDYYHADSSTPNICEIIPRKRRSNDPYTKCDLYWYGRTTSFRNLTRPNIAF